MSSAYKFKYDFKMTSSELYLDLRNDDYIILCKLGGPSMSDFKVK